ncbi:energy transducer TonB [uncultured Tenacibaculum sp.]|uniref:energy transducer TonB n=1 Tax=uncultured Tenacibaculum sp. TaxID=174713 RepID=UPI002618D36B|nr:energy transducer TonB [uncultured Tenacibaculum sp.]
MKTKFSVLLLFLGLLTYAQKSETCDTPENDPLLDLNSITKCTIEKSDDKKKNKKVSFQVTSRRRIKRKKDLVKGVNNNFSKKISEVKKKTQIVNSLTLEKVDDNAAVSFFNVDEIPLFESCEDVAIMKQNKCFKSEITEHIKNNFQYPNRSYNKGIQGRVLVNFVINKEGNVSISNTLFPYKGEELRDEANRIVNKLPKFIPGKQSGVKVNVQYTLKIMFDIPGVKKTNIRKKVKTINLDEVYTFDELQRTPTFKECFSSFDDSFDCFANELKKHVIKNFAYPVEALDNNIEGIVYVSFIINSEGDIVNIKAKGPNNGKILEIAAKRLVEKLPKLKAGYKDNKRVNTKYQFPIEFSLNDE